MSTLPTLGFMIGESMEDHDLKKRGYTDKTNDCLAGDNATPLPSGDIAAVGMKAPPQVRTPEPAEGVSFRKAMADQGDQEQKLSFTRR
jgi:hypothetical protein